MNLKTSSRSPAPGVQQQQQAEALSKQRAQAQQQQQAQQAASAAYAAGMHNMSPGYPSSPHVTQQPQAPPMYGNVYTPTHQGAPPPYPANPPAAYGQQVPMIQQPPPAAASMQPYPPQPTQSQQQNLYAQATTRAGRQRASTMDGNGTGIPPALQRVVSHLDPNAPIRLQPSPAYYPPPQEGQEAIGNVGGRRRQSRAVRTDQNRNFIRALEDRTLEEGWSGSGQGSAQGWPGSNNV
jgi:dual specificity protein kinase YAK1